MYEIEFEYLVPEWGTIEIDDPSITREEVEEYAVDHIEMSYPEAQDIKILSIRNTNGS